MSDTNALFDTLRQSADNDVVGAIEAVIRDGTDRQLCRINIVNFSAEHDLDEEKVSGKRDFEARDKSDEMTSQIQSPLFRDRSLAALAAKSRLFDESQEILVRMGMRGGPGRSATA